MFWIVDFLSDEPIFEFIAALRMKKLGKYGEERYSQNMNKFGLQSIRYNFL